MNGPGVAEEKITDLRQLLLLLLGGLLLRRLLSLFLRSHVQLLYRLFGSERRRRPPKRHQYELLAF